MEAMAKGLKEKPDEFPKIFTCPNEMVALSMADGYARVTNEPQCVIIHVDVGTSGLGAAIHNAATGRAPVLIFAGLSPFTLEGEMRGSRTEYMLVKCASSDLHNLPSNNFVSATGSRMFLTRSRSWPSTAAMWERSGQAKTSSKWLAAHCSLPQAIRRDQCI